VESQVYFLEREDQVFIIKKLAKQLGIKLKFIELPPSYGGNFYIPTQTISLNKNWTSSLLNVFFHEVGHWHATNTGKFKVFHAGRSPRNEKEFYIYAATALRAERWVDNWGRALMAEVFPDMYYYRAYQGSNTEFIDHQIEAVRRNMKKPPPMIRRVARLYKKRQKAEMARQLFLSKIKAALGIDNIELKVVTV
jgi:hypothetical protein